MFTRYKYSIPDSTVMPTVIPTKLLVSKQNPFSCYNLPRRDLNIVMFKHEQSYTQQYKGQNGNNRVWKQVYCCQPD
jgi:hypothetical protein